MKRAAKCERRCKKKGRKYKTTQEKIQEMLNSGKRGAVIVERGPSFPTFQMKAMMTAIDENVKKMGETASRIEAAKCNDESHVVMRAVKLMRDRSVSNRILKWCSKNEDFQTFKAVKAQLCMYGQKTQGQTAKERKIIKQKEEDNMKFNILEVDPSARSGSSSGERSSGDFSGSSSRSRSRSDSKTLSIQVPKGASSRSDQDSSH